MIPIHELLSRIQWDEEFVIGYYDRVRDEVVAVPLAELGFDKDDHLF